jgi:hypothetical protein
MTRHACACACLARVQGLAVSPPDSGPALKELDAATKALDRASKAAVTARDLRIKASDGGPKAVRGAGGPGSPLARYICWLGWLGTAARLPCPAQAAVDSGLRMAFVQPCNVS